jgi:predicted DNA-binding protein (MmcQ/YjbR family)
MNKTHWNPVKVMGMYKLDLLQVLIKNSLELTKPKE